MACLHPLEAYRNKNGELVWRASQGVGLCIRIPCSQCTGCKLDRAKTWALRCTHEAQLHTHNVYVTLTYDKKFLPPGGTLVKEHLQGFLKALRNARRKTPIRFFACGEYGTKLSRPHYHLIIFGTHFPDQKPWKVRRGFQTWISDELSKLWGKGFCEIGTVTYQSAGYVARYITKKITGPGADKHYEFVDPETGEVFQRLPEYIAMSTHPGLGSGWFDKYQQDVFNGDSIIHEGRKHKVPRYYDKLTTRAQGGHIRMFDTKRKRKLKALTPENIANQTPERLEVRRKVQKAKLKNLKRSYEEGDDET